MEGTVKWFNADKGYGFIKPSNGGKDVFVHYTALRKGGILELTEDQSVTFEVERGAKGDTAIDLKLIG